MSIGRGRSDDICIAEFSETREKTEFRPLVLKLGVDGPSESVPEEVSDEHQHGRVPKPVNWKSRDLVAYRNKIHYYFATKGPRRYAIWKATDVAFGIFTDGSCRNHG